MREEGRIYESSVVTTAGNLCNTSRRWDREATQQGMVDDGRACVIRTAGWYADMRSHMLHRAWGRGAVSTTGRVRGGAP